MTYKCKLINKMRSKSNNEEQFLCFTILRTGNSGGRNFSDLFDVMSWKRLESLKSLVIATGLSLINKERLSVFVGNTVVISCLLLTVFQFLYSTSPVTVAERCKACTGWPRHSLSG
jgi:hypothetical protein